MYVCVCARMYKHICVHTYVHIYIDMYMHMYIYYVDNLINPTVKFRFTFLDFEVPGLGDDRELEFSVTTVDGQNPA